MAEKVETKLDEEVRLYQKRTHEIVVRDCRNCYSSKTISINSGKSVERIANDLKLVLENFDKVMGFVLGGCKYAKKDA